MDPILEREKGRKVIFLTDGKDNQDMESPGQFLPGDDYKTWSGLEALYRGSSVIALQNQQCRSHTQRLVLEDNKNSIRNWRED